jgi:DHA2 family multidrug resistance protein
MRNIGASIGISLMSYLLVHNSAITQAALVEHITPYRQVVRDTLTSSILSPSADPPP